MAPTRRPWVPSHPTRSSPERAEEGARGSHAPSVPDVALVTGNAVPAQEFPELLLERSMAVMSFLGFYVPANLQHPGLAHGERPLAPLPEEPLQLRPLLLDPLRGPSLHPTADIRDRCGAGEMEEDLKVIGCRVQRET